MHSKTWKLLSVSDFLDRYREHLALETTEEQAVTQDELIWQKQTVHTFFVEHRWVPQPLGETNAEPFGLRLSVQSYFQYFDWNAPTKSLNQPSKVTSLDSQDSEPFTHSNLSDLF